MLRFPLGELPKEETRALARELGLSVAEKADSQDICFVPQGKYSTVIERLKPGAVRPGPIVHIDGRVLGEHQGIVHYTVGQRRGLGLSVGEPLYVVRLDASGARVIVGPREALSTRTIRIADVNWLGDTALEGLGERPLEVAVRVRSTREPRPALLRFDGTGAMIELMAPEDGVSPGQACVMYDSDAPRARVLGGGTIARTQAEAAAA
jgi:tRNA-specific 2-thiouridylase